MERENLIREFQRDRIRLIAYIRALVGDPDLTEDIFQETTVVVLQKAEEFQFGRDLPAWCRGIARNLVLRHREQAGRLRLFEGSHLLDLVDVAFSEQRETEFLDARRSLLRRCMELLAPPSRDLLGLRYEQGLSLRDVAQRLDRTEPAVQVALSRVRKWLADCVQKRGDSGAEVVA